jgi:hypothetical protein
MGLLPLTPLRFYKHRRIEIVSNILASANHVSHCAAVEALNLLHLKIAFGLSKKWSGVS